MRARQMCVCLACVFIGLNTIIIVVLKEQASWMKQGKFVTKFTEDRCGSNLGNIEYRNKTPTWRHKCAKDTETIVKEYPN